jgi:hypothetical protein
VIAQQQKRSKVLGDEEIYVASLQNFLENTLDKAGKRLEGRRMYDMIRLYMKTVKEISNDKLKVKNIEIQEKICYQKFEKLVREIADGNDDMKEDSLEWVTQATIDSQLLIEWTRHVFSKNVAEHRKIVDKHQTHALKMAVRTLQTRLKTLVTNTSRAPQYSTPKEFKSWLDVETGKLGELFNVFNSILMKQPKYQVHISSASPLKDLFLSVNGELVYRSENGWFLGYVMSIFVVFLQTGLTNNLHHISISIDLTVKWKFPCGTTRKLLEKPKAVHI